MQLLIKKVLILVGMSVKNSHGAGDAVGKCAYRFECCLGMKDHEGYDKLSSSLSSSYSNLLRELKQCCGRKCDQVTVRIAHSE